MKSLSLLVITLIFLNILNAQNVGIGTSTPTNRLHVTSSAATSNNATILGVNTGSVGTGIFGLSNASGTYGVQGFSTSGVGVYGNSNNYRAIYGSTETGTALYGYSSEGYGLQTVGKVKISGGNTNPSNGAVLTSDAVGNAVWKQDRVAFSAEGVNTNYNTFPHSVYRRIHFASMGLYDLSNSYQLLVGTNVQPNSSSFIVPIRGVYHFDLGTEIGGINYEDEPTITEAILRLQRNRNGTITTIAANSFPDIIKGGFYSNARLTISKDFIMEAGDIIYVEAYYKNATSQTMGLAGSYLTYFNGHLVKDL